MGCIWKITMVLLSTLAALVIIVHSAEEEYEAQMARRQLRPRMLDTGASRSYEQPWRTLDLEPVEQATTPDDLWMANSSGEPPRRRRPGRKRKRRPDTSSSEETVPIARYGYAEDNVRPYIEVDAERKSEDAPRKRRKKQDTTIGRWDSQEEERPLRRRAQRRKRPSVESWPTFSDLNDSEPDREVKFRAPVGPIRTMGDDYRQYKKRQRVEEPYPPSVENSGTIVDATQHVNNLDLDYEHQTESEPEAEVKEDTLTKNDKSVSEFSAEDVNPLFVQDSYNENTQNKVKSKSENYLKNIDKVKMIRDAQKAGPIDPQTLKEVLKKSNGSSLSEILQQNNLTLTDLLHGKEEVLSVLKLDTQTSTDNSENAQADDVITEAIEISDDKEMQNSETKYFVTSKNENESSTNQNNEEVTTELYVEATTSEKPKTEEALQRPNIRRFSTATRRKQRIRPMLNTTYKSQLSRDMIALNARKYFNNRRKNNPEWRDFVPTIKKNFTTQAIKAEVETTTNVIDETTTQEVENCTRTDETENETNVPESLEDIEVINNKEQSNNVGANADTVQQVANVTQKSIVQSQLAPVNASTLRRQAFNNRLKKKRLKQKNLTTESPQDDIIMDLFGMPNLVSSSEFIAQTARPKQSRTEGTPKTNLDDVTLDDFITTVTPNRRQNRKKNKNRTTTTTTSQPVLFPVSTEETAKIEIEEIFNDTETSQTLARILKERNMTLSELVEHRERGSSHVHLADIFHNASKEPNPPEPFLSKSLIEPISKETYPLRALIDANIHDTTAKPSSTDPVTLQTEVNIPVVMNFGNNVNENAENMGIMSLFHNITKNNTSLSKPSLNKDSQGTLYESSITVVNTTEGRNENNTVRESRVLHVVNDKQDDIVSWNEIFSLMRKNYENQTDLLNEPTNDIIPAEKIKPPSLEEDLDGDGVIILEDLQRLKDFDTNFAAASNENLDFNTYQRTDDFTTANILDKIPSQTRSVTVATASIAGLAMILFLLTFIGYKWQQHRSNTRKNLKEEHVPTPVFENRKGNKNNSSSRSISPMLSSNIYTVNTLDSRNGKESPDYMWDSLRKPFQ